jgi:hypothetical protein
LQVRYIVDGQQVEAVAQPHRETLLVRALVPQGLAQFG